MTAVKTYSPAEVALVVGGVPVENFTSIKISYDNDRVKITEGSGGEATRTINVSKMGTIEIELPQTTGANALLSGQDQLFKSSVLSSMIPFNISLFEDAMIPILVKDNKGFSEHVMNQATLVKAPDATYGMDAGNRTWVYKGSLDVHINAGN